MDSYRGFSYYATWGTQFGPKSLKASFNKDWSEKATLQSDIEQEFLPLQCLSMFYH